MTSEKLTLEETGSFSSLFLDYLTQKDVLKTFYSQFPELSVFEQLIADRNFDPEVRTILSKDLLDQYNGIEMSEKVKTNIESLAEDNTFSVTTGHQLNIFTGPLYFIYKILTVVNACEVLKEKHPDKNFVPVYWMASEDHDFEEISHFNLFGKTYAWESDQKGAVGRFKTDGLKALCAELPEKVDVFEDAYGKSSCLADAVRFYVNALFGKYGVVVVDGDRPNLKAIMAPVVANELENHTGYEAAVKATKDLEEQGYKSQIFPRPINFFYLEDGLRERIEKEGDAYKVLNSDKSFNADEIQELLSKHPECFSPNVVMRPLYQEMVLPNLAYVGGPAEVVYWLQLKGVFDHYGVAFPALMPRNFAMVVNKGIKKKIDKNDLPLGLLFKDKHEIKAAYVDREAANEFTLNGERAELDQFFEKLKAKAGEIDGSLSGYIGAENAKVLKMLDNIEKRLKKSEEQKHETALNQIDNIKDKLFPGGGLQERKENFLNFYLNNPDFIDQIKAEFDPFDYRFNVLMEG